MNQFKIHVQSILPVINVVQEKTFFQQIKKGKDYTLAYNSTKLFKLIEEKLTESQTGEN